MKPDEEVLKDYYWAYDLGIGISETTFIESMTEQFISKDKVKELLDKHSHYDRNTCYEYVDAESIREDLK